jgi:hypothetical protein
VTITGTQLKKVSQVIFGQTKATQFTIVNNTTITATAPDVSATHGTGFTTDVTVVSAAGLPSPSVSADQFTYTSLAPVITSVIPASGGAGAVITIRGHYFKGATCAGIDPTECDVFTVIDDSTIVTSIPADWFQFLISPTTVDMFVCNTYGCSTKGSNDAFTILPKGTTSPTPNPNPAPTITGFSPTSGPVGTTVTITGANLALPGLPPPAVGWLPQNGIFCGGIASVNPDGSLTATLPSCARSGEISVTTAGGLAISSQGFTIIYPAPTITGFSPTSGPTGAVLTITGANLQPLPYPENGAGVLFTGCGGDPTYAVNTVPTDNGAQMVTVPSCAVTGPLTIFTAGGSATSAQIFTSTTNPPPTLTGFTPSSGPAGTLITLTGTNLVTPGGSAQVLFTGCAGAPAVSATQPDGTITATVSACAQTGPLTVFTTGGSTTSTQVFTVTGSSPIPTPTSAPSPTSTPLPAPTITGFTPISGPVGTLVNLTGTDLALPGSTTSVLFTGCGSGPTATFVLATPQPDGTLTVTVPTCAQTGPLTVFTAGGSATSVQSFTVS